MSLYKPSFGISALSGRIGGTVYARNRGGLYARAGTSPVQPDSPDQVDKYAIWTESAAAFRDLTNAELDVWHTYASKLTKLNRLGESFRLTAQQIFTECFTNASLAGLTPLTLPSQHTNRPAITSVGAIDAHSDGTEIVGLTLLGASAETVTADTAKLLLSAAPCLRPSIRNVNNQFRLIKVWDTDGSDIKYLDEYIAKFGSTALPNWVAHLRLRVVDPNTMLGSTRLLHNGIIA